MKTAISHLLALVALVLAGCASDPLMSGKPQDWVGHQTSDVRAHLGEPTRIIPSGKGEIWEYETVKDYVVPRGENEGWGFGEKRYDDRQAHEVQLTRFKVRGGKVSDWYASRTVNGKIVWEDH